MDAFEVAQKGYIVTLGIWPDKPDTGYGYIKVSPMLKTPDYRSRRQNLKVYRVDKFIEKPPLRKARQFFKDKRFYWNAGIFIFKAEALVAEVRRLEPQAYRVLQHVKDFSSAKESWRRFPSTSIDYAIMEQAEKMALLPLDCGWVDLGNWLAIEKINKKDKYGNISRGNHYDRDSRDISVWARKRLIVTLGLRSLVVVDTPDALLICAKDKVGGLKEIIARVKAKEE
jgi:mannose-1-phosphate guanylyltransferase